MTERPSRKRIAVVGSGISGLSAAWLLARNHDVVLLEKDQRPGGHAHTRTIDIDGTRVDVDTGFIVYNPRNYPNFIRLLDELDVETADSDMSFSASLDNGGFEYSSNLHGLFAQRRNLARPRMWRMLSDLNRLYAYSRDRSPSREQGSLDEFLLREGYSRAFREDHILPMCAAIWSSPADQMRDFPAESFFNFFTNHGLLQFADRPHWRTIRGGSHAYVTRLLQDFTGEVRHGVRIRTVGNTDTGALITYENGDLERFDDVILACHSDQALDLLDAPTDRETALLGSIAYRPNRAVLHTDTRFLPNRKSAWASWNYLAKSGPDGHRDISLTYWMNKLQPLPTEVPVLVTLNPEIEPDPAKILHEDHYEHPVFDAAAIAAQDAIGEIQGSRNIWYCGAWLGSGFHEDGLQSGLAAAEAVGGYVRPWGLDGMTGRVAWHPARQPATTGAAGLRIAAE